MKQSMSTLSRRDLDTRNAGDWVIHCRDGYQAEAGMTIALEYAT